MHLDRIYVFCLLQELVETSGVFVVRSSMVRIAGAKRQLMTQMDPVKSGFQGAGRGRRDPSIHKTAVIIGGPFKGYRGIVKNANDTQMTIELNTNGKMISVDRTKVQIQGYRFY